MADTSARVVPNCKVMVDGSPLDPPVQASLVRLSIDLDADLFAQTTLLFSDPQMKLIGGDTFACGAALKIKLGYGANLEQLFDGEVVRLEPQFRKDQPIALMVVCQEPMHRLALSQSTRSLNDVDVSEVVKQIAQEHGFSSDAPSGTKQHIMQGNISNATMLRRLGTRLGMRVRVEGKKLIMGPPPSTDPIPLLMKDGIRKVKVKLKSAGQVSEISVHGWDPKNKQEVVGKAKPQGEIGKGGTDYGDSAAIADSSGDNLPPDQATAEAMAKGRMTKLNEGYIKSQTDMIGDARMVPGQQVSFDKMGPGIDGTWRIERAMHDFSKRGYFVKMEAVRISAKKPAPPAPPKTKQEVKQDTDGRLMRPRWKRRADTNNDIADMAVDASKSLEGKSVKFVLETRVDGTWKQVAEAQGTVSSGTATATANLDKLDTSDFTNPKWTAAKDSQHTHGDSGEVSMTAKAKDGIEVRVILEQQVGKGWERVAQKISSVKGGEVKAAFTLEHPFAEEAGKPTNKLLKIPSWSNHPQVHGGAGSVQVRAPGLPYGRQVQFEMEMQGADGKWTLVRSVQGKIDRGSAAISLPDVRHPALNQQPAHADVLKNPTWAKGDLSHGDAGTFSVEAPDLDGRVVAFIVERNDNGTWTQLVRTMATVASGKASATAKIAHPTALTHKPDLSKTKSQLSSPRWSTLKTAHGEEVEAIINAVGLEGATVEFVAERKEAGGWVEAGRGRGVVKSGKASASISVSHPRTDAPATPAPASGPQVKPKLANPRWDDAQLTHGDQATALIDAEGLEGATIQFIAERLEQGGWVEAGRGTGVVSGGKASSALQISHPGTDASPRKLRFRTHVLHNPDDALDAPLAAKYDPKTGKVTAATGGDHDGRTVRFILERRKPTGWLTVATSTARAANGTAAGKLPTAPVPGGKLASPRWTTTKVAHGDEAQLEIDAKGLDGQRVKFVLERLDGQSWVGVGAAIAKVSGGKAKATVPVSHPQGHDLSAAALPPKLLRPRWDSSHFEHGDVATAIIDTQGLEGATIEFIAEHAEGNSWVEAGRAQGVSKGGKASAVLQLKHPGTDASLRKFRFRATILHNPNPPPGKVPEPAKLRFQATLLDQVETRARAELLPDLDPRHLRFRANVVDNPKDAEPPAIPVTYDPKTGAASGTVAGANDNRMVRFILEEKNPSSWHQLAAVTARVVKGVAQVKLPVHHKANAALGSPRWADPTLQHGDTAELMVSAKGLDGHRVKFTVERFDGSSWSDAGNTLAPVKGGVAKGSVTVTHPAGSALSKSKLRFRAELADPPQTRVRAEMLPDIDPRRLRFRAELVPDHTKQKLRFVAKPVPDLLPKKIRFRGELPVPQDPALTRMRVSVVGGGADDAQTGGPSSS